MNDTEQRESHLKNAIGTKKWWLTVAPVVLVLLIGMLVYDAKTAEGAPATNATEGPVAGASLKYPVCETDCQNEWAKKRTRQFDKGKLGNAKGKRLPKHIRKRLAKKQAAMQAAGTWKAQAGPIDWWRENLKFNSCIIWNPISVNQSTCGAGQKAVNNTLLETNKLMFRCGGLAVIGALAGGGGWGAAKAGGGCLFGHAALEIYE